MRIARARAPRRDGAFLFCGIFQPLLGHGHTSTLDLIISYRSIRLRISTGNSTSDARVQGAQLRDDNLIRIGAEVEPYARDRVRSPRRRPSNACFLSQPRRVGPPQILSYDCIMRPDPDGRLLELESDAAEADEHVTLGLGKSAIYGGNATGTRREFLSS
jgi:hypothetical protein